MPDIPLSLSGVVVICTACGTRAASWVQLPAGTICFDCNVKRAARAVLSDEIAAREAALRRIAQAASDGADAMAAAGCSGATADAIRSRFETIAAIAQAALQEDSRDD